MSLQTLVGRRLRYTTTGEDHLILSANFRDTEGRYYALIVSKDGVMRNVSLAEWNILVPLENPCSPPSSSSSQLSQSPPPPTTTTTGASGPSCLPSSASGSSPCLTAELKPAGSGGILQDWVCRLGLRHQGVLVSAVRGCDNVPKEDPSKALTRSLRAVILRAHCGDPKKAGSFIQKVSYPHLQERMFQFRKNVDHLPHHYVMHLVHAVEIVGYHYPDEHESFMWRRLYLDLCKGLHINPETKEQLDARLNADETTFVQSQG